MNQAPVDPAVQAGLEHVVEGLCEQFGEAYPRETIARMVAELHDSLVPYRVGHYVPLLVHRVARERLQRCQSGEPT